MCDSWAGSLFVSFGSLGVVEGCVAAVANAKNIYAEKRDLKSSKPKNKQATTERNIKEKER